MTKVVRRFTSTGCARRAPNHSRQPPRNIILIPDKTVKLSGFGLARAATDAHLTRAGAVLGELKYMPPEQVKGMATLDGRSDIYSAGAVLYEAVTGTAPFGSGSKSQFNLMLEQVAAMPQPPSKVRLDVPTHLDPLILNCNAILLAASLAPWSSVSRKSSKGTLFSATSCLASVSSSA
jgi:serine/threonine protein kinase